MAYQSYPGMLIIEDSSKASWEWDAFLDVENGYEITGKSRNVILNVSKNFYMGFIYLPDMLEKHCDVQQFS